jgi:hypothetical protein
LGIASPTIAAFRREDDDDNHALGVCMLHIGKASLFFSLLLSFFYLPLARTLKAKKIEHSKYPEQTPDAERFVSIFDEDDNWPVI